MKKFVYITLVILLITNMQSVNAQAKHSLNIFNENDMEGLKFKFRQYLIDNYRLTDTAYTFYVSLTFLQRDQYNVQVSGADVYLKKDIYKFFKNQNIILSPFAAKKRVLVPIGIFFHPPDTKALKDGSMIVFEKMNDAIKGGDVYFVQPWSMNVKYIERPCQDSDNWSWEEGVSQKIDTTVLNKEIKNIWKKSNVWDSIPSGVR
jgi:hypothetical protein